MADKNGGNRGIRNLLPNRLGAKRHVINAVKQSARRRNIPYILTEDEAINLIQDICYYCGRKPSSIVKEGSKFVEPFLYNGIDRVDNSKGYERSNVVTCCYRCNVAKSDQSLENFLAMIRDIYEKTIKPHETKK